MAESNIFVREELTEDDDYLMREDDEDFANFLSSPGDPEPYRIRNRICSDHFAKDDYEEKEEIRSGTIQKGRYLKDSAIPCVAQLAGQSGTAIEVSN